MLRPDGAQGFSVALLTDRPLRKNVMEPRRPWESSPDRRFPAAERLTDKMRIRLYTTPPMKDARRDNPTRSGKRYQVPSSVVAGYVAEHRCDISSTLKHHRSRRASGP